MAAARHLLGNRSASLVLVAVLVGCSGAVPSSDRSALPSVSIPASATIQPSADVKPIPLSAGCSEDARCTIDPGTYQTPVDGFIPGMAVTFPIPWSSREHWQSELELDPVEPRQIGEVRLWIDMAPGASATVADPKRQFDAAGMVDWISSNRELAVSSKQSVAVAGLPAVVLDWTVSPTATSGIDAFCTAGCALTIGRPHVNCCIGYGPGEHVREYVMDIGPTNERHTLMIDIDSESQAKLDQLDGLLRPIIDSLVFPDEWFIWCGRTGPPHHDCSG